MSFLHVTTICVTHVTDAFTDKMLTNDDTDFTLADTALSPTDLDRQTFEEAVACDPIALCCSTVCAIWASGKQCNHFCQIMRDGNNKEWFEDEKGKTIQVLDLELLRDV